MADGQRLKNGLKRNVRRAMRLAGPWLKSARQPTSRILTYHSIGHRRYEMNVAPEHFSEQMAWLAAAPYPVIPLDAAAQGEPGVAITFDDGYADNLQHAVPILTRHQFPATIFVVSGHLGSTLPREQEPESGRLMTPDELREATAHGIQIGAHTAHHPRLATLPPASQEQEIVTSKQDLEALLNTPVTAFAYPYGAALDFSLETEQLVAAAGFSYACANQYGHNSPVRNRWALRRIWIDSTDTPASFADKVSGRLDAMALQDSAVGIRFRRLLNRGLGTR